MPTYPHYQALKAASRLPKHDKIGACLTCKYWKVDEYRTEALVGEVALCVQPQLKPYALIVSGGSACNKWVAKPNKEPEAAEYAERGEEDKDVQKQKAKQVAARKRAAAT